MIRRCMDPVLSTGVKRQMTSSILKTLQSPIRSPAILRIMGARDNMSTSPHQEGSVVKRHEQRDLSQERETTGEPYLTTDVSTRGKGSSNIRDPAKEVSVETSMRYMKSTGYKETYGDNRVWVLYRRNFKGQFAPKTRKSCFYKGKLTTGNPCPVCRDEFLVLDYRNTDLLKQFISAFNGEVLGTEKTGLCQEKHFHLLAEIEKAKDYGTITFDIRFREFDYEEYYPKDLLDKLKEHSNCNHS